MKLRSTHLAFATFLTLTVIGTTAHAQTGPDIRNIRPHVMLLLETAGSMARKPTCVCTTPACTECLPDCSVNEENRWSIVTEALTGEWPAADFECVEKARFTDATDTYTYDEGYFIPDYKLPHRITTYAGGPQADGLLDDYKDRVKFGLMTMDGVGTLITDGAAVLRTNFEAPAYLADSINYEGLFSYGERKPFTFPTQSPTEYMIDSGARSDLATQVAQLALLAAPFNDPTNASGALTSPDDDSVNTTTHTTEVEAQVLNVRPFGASPTSALLTDFRYFLQNDPHVFEKVAAGVDADGDGFDDGDSYYNCRNRSAILIVDGFANGELRGTPYFCENLGNPVGATGCPYDEAENVITDMITAGEVDNVYVIGFSLSDPTEEALLKAYLDDLAAVGDTDEATLVSDVGELVDAISAALNAVNPGATSRTAPVFTGITPGTDPTTGTAFGLPAFEFLSGFNPSFDVSDPWDGFLERRRFQCSGDVPVAQNITDADRFQTVLNNQSSAPANVEPYSGGVLASVGGAFSRNLWTVLESNDATGAASADTHLIGNGRDKIDSTPDPRIRAFSDVSDGTRDVDAFALDKNLDPAVFGLASTSDRDDLVDWIHGVSGSGREDQRLGDIYHSTPAVVGPIATDTEDGTFNQWRVGTGGFQKDPDPTPVEDPPTWRLNVRPRIVYAASNDGVIHAFLADTTQVGFYGTTINAPEFACADGKDAGTELWGFVPPMFLQDLDALKSSPGTKKWFADGNIVVRDLLDVRALDSFTSETGGTSSNAGGFTVTVTNVWRTVLLMSFRNGGSGMIALDVTNPCRPEFLWQFTDPDLGPTFGQPTAGSVVLKTDNDDVFNPRQIRSAIFLPGGGGNRDMASEPCVYPAPGPGAPLADPANALPTTMTQADGTTSITPRANRRCWHTTSSGPGPSGRALYVIDSIEGSLIRKFDDTEFPAPVSGSVSVFRGDTATIARSGYVQDEDGILWRIDMTENDPADWSVTALHDLYYDAVALDTPQPGYTAPTLTVDSNQNVVILHTTGNIDILDDATAVNRVVSITERLTFDPVTGALTDIDGELNWDLNGGDEFDAGEQVTGPLDLFAGNVFFGSFNAAGVDPVDSCPFEGSRIWGVTFLDDPANVGNPEPRLTNSLGTAVTNLDSSDIPALGNTLVMGLRVAQVTTCLTLTSVNVTDPFTGLTRTISSPAATSGRAFKLVAQLSGAETGTGGASIGIFEQDMPDLGSLSTTSITAIADVIE